MAPNVNNVILRSIPISKELKRYLVKKYMTMVQWNGKAYAAEKFSLLREVCLSYRADPQRLQRQSIYLRNFPFRKNGWARKILAYMDSHPHFMLDFLKLYIGMEKPIVSVEQSAQKQHEYLKSRKDIVDDRVPSFLIQWLQMVKNQKYTLSGLPRPLRLAIGNSSQERSKLDRYLKKWNGILFHHSLLSEESAVRAIQSKAVVPEMYKSVTHVAGLGLFSENFQEDYDMLYAITNLSSGWSYASSPISDIVASSVYQDWGNRSGLSKASLSFISSYLPGLTSGLGDIRPDKSLMQSPGKWFSGHRRFGAFVGCVHHIPKKGTVKRRPIAVPNRFIQMGLNPLRLQLEKVLKRLPKDCTFDQGRFDQRIQTRVNSRDLYVGSVDISQATDNIPLSWGNAILELISERWHQTVKESLTLFEDVSRGSWLNDNRLSRWTIGQPLGALPSFSVLSLTHNILLEALSFAWGYLHSPYAVLGDDVLFFNRRLRSKYIYLFNKVGIPLSLHKSFDGNLVEFAGKIFIKNQPIRYVSDHAPLTWESLFDYQRATGVRIPYGHLPFRIRRRIERLVEGPVSGLNAKHVYELAMHYATLIRGEPIQSECSKLVDLIVEVENPQPMLSKEADYFLGPIAHNGWTVSYHWKTGEKNDRIIRFKESRLPEWYRDKFRPVSTDKLLTTALKIMQDDNQLGLVG